VRNTVADPGDLRPQIACHHAQLNARAARTARPAGLPALPRPVCGSLPGTRQPLALTIPDSPRMLVAGDRGRTGDLPDVLARLAKPR